jgi:hypothetical protein
MKIKYFGCRGVISHISLASYGVLLCSELSFIRTYKTLSQLARLRQLEGVELHDAVIDF